MTTRGQRSSACATNCSASLNGGFVTMHSHPSGAFRSRRKSRREKIGAPVVDEIRADDLVTVRAQHIDDVAVAGGRLPQAVRKRLDAQQCLNRDARRAVAIRAALGEGMASDLAAMIEHHAFPVSNAAVDVPCRRPETDRGQAPGLCPSGVCFLDKRESPTRGPKAVRHLTFEAAQKFANFVCALRFPFVPPTDFVVSVSHRAPPLVCLAPCGGLSGGANGGRTRFETA